MRRPPVFVGLAANRLDSIATPLTCRWRESGRESAWVHVAGELDIATAPLLEQTLIQADLHARLIVLDLRELTFMDSAGVHVIVQASMRAWLADHRLIVVRGPSQVDRVFELAGATDAVEIGELDAGGPSVELPFPLVRDDHAA